MTALRATLLLLLAAPVSLPAEDGLRSFLQADDARGAPVINPNTCTGGVRYDDGSYEGAVGFANAVERGAYVMAFDLPPNYVGNSVCLCWTRTNFSNGTGLDFDVVFYAADGVDGAPGTFLGRTPSRADNVPDFNVGGVAQYRVQLPATPLPQRVFIGAEWQPFVDRQYFLCNDATAANPLNEAWSSVDGVEWEITSDIRPSYRALGTVLYGGVPQPPRPVPLTWVAPITALLLGFGTLALRRVRRRQIAD